MNEFIEAKSIIDEAEELRRKMITKAARALTKSMVSRHNGANSRNTAKTLNDIDKLLENFSLEEKYAVMKEVFVNMC